MNDLESLCNEIKVVKSKGGDLSDFMHKYYTWNKQCHETLPNSLTKLEFLKEHSRKFLLQA